MAKDFRWIKSVAIEQGRTLKALADDCGYSYDYFYQVINGFKTTPKDFEAKVKSVLIQWNKTESGRVK